MSFIIEDNFDFYCFLKAKLPVGYKIISEPSKEYYSEWYFNYQIFNGDKLVEEVSGNYKDIEEGFLVEKAKQLLKKLN